MTDDLDPVQKSSFLAILEVSKDAEDISWKFWNQHHGMMRATARALERKYDIRELSFTVPFRGAVPVEAYGTLGDFRFYFRYRYDHGSLVVGPVNDPLEIAIAAKLNARRDEALEGLRLQFLAGEVDEDEMSLAEGAYADHPDEVPQQGDDAEYKPRDIRMRSDIFDFTGEPFAGTLKPMKAFGLFSLLVDGLYAIPQDEWIDPWTQRWLREVSPHT